jgi:thiol-disulfide isomerase/thioredoxin
LKLEFVEVTKISILLAGLFLGGALLGDDLESIRKAPELKFVIPSEGQKTLSQYEGKVVALEFIFTTCPHCKAASHMMTKLQREYGPRGLQVIDIAVNPNSDLLVDDFAKEQQVNFPVGWTQSDTMTTFMGFSPGRYVVPQLVLIDRKGFIHYQTPATEDEKWDRMMKEETIRQHIEQLLWAKSSKNKSERLSSQTSGGRNGR